METPGSLSDTSDFPIPAPARAPQPLAPALREAIREYVDAHRVIVEDPPQELVEKLDAARLPAFRDTLLSMIRARGLIDSHVCAAAGVDRRHYSKIRNNPDYHPTKATAVSFAFALRLNLRDASKLLRSAGYAFTASSDFDLICSYFLEERIWDSFTVNDALYAYGQPLICGMES